MRARGRAAPGDEPIAFAGEAAPGCTLVSGATLDLNLMVRRGAGAAPRRSSAGSAGTSMRLARSPSSQRSRHPWRALCPCTVPAARRWRLARAAGRHAGLVGHKPGRDVGAGRRR
ncbi:MAG: HutD family protein [Betaproteobacteria bacterium]|nr:HutD family protein [Betaproteobacteria bacterium]